MNEQAVPAVAPVDRPVFVIGERLTAIELVQALGETPTLYAMPASRLLAELAWAVDRCAPSFEPITGLADLLLPAAWYRDVQLRQLRISGKARTVEFCGLSAVRLCALFPNAQFLVVRRLKRAMPRSRRMPELAQGRLLEIDCVEPITPETVERVLAFLGEPVLLDLSDEALRNLHAEHPGWAMEMAPPMPQPGTRQPSGERRGAPNECDDRTSIDLGDRASGTPGGGRPPHP